MGTGEKVKELLEAGETYSKICKFLGISKATISYHVKKQGLGSSDRVVYDWAEVQRYYNSHPKVMDCRAHFGMSASAWSAAVARGDLVYATTSEKFLVKGRYVGGHTLKKALLEQGVVYRCSGCGLTDWQGSSITLQVDHINGERLDNSLDNLRFLCPNCHSQTETFAGRNVRLRRLS